MFGGHGLYCKGVMFGLIDDDELFLKTDAESREAFVAAGCVMWTYPGFATTSYFRPPDVAHEDPEAMRPWADLALDAARRKRAARQGQPRGAAEHPRPRRKGTKPALAKKDGRASSKPRRGR
jgi:DNA transformation protein